MAKPPKYPKSMGACADLLYDLRQKRLDADKVAAALKEEEVALQEHIINTLPKGDTGASGLRYKVQVKTEPRLRVSAEKWPEFFGWVSKNKAWDVLQKRLSDKALVERSFDAKGKPRAIPGVETFPVVKVSLTKV